MNVQQLNMVSLILFGVTVFNLLLLVIQLVFSVSVLYEYLFFFWALIPGAVLFFSLLFLLFKRNIYIYLSIVVNAGVLGLFYYALTHAFA